MHTKRIIPCLDVKNGRVVKGVNFINLKDAGDPVEIASYYNRSMADEIVFLDITASYDARDIILDVVKWTAEQLIKEAAEKFGNQCVVVAIDAKARENGGFDVYLNGGRVNTGRDALEWALEAEDLGAGEILLTSMDCDGVKNGYDIALTKTIASNVRIPVIASGGAGNKKHFYDVLTEGEADAALAASLFHFKELEIVELKQYLKQKQIAVRL